MSSLVRVLTRRQLDRTLLTSTIHLLKTVLERSARTFKRLGGLLQKHIDMANTVFFTRSCTLMSAFTHVHDRDLRGSIKQIFRLTGILGSERQ